MRLLKQVSKSINNRNGLPRGYTEVEYIASSGNAEFLNTGVLPTYNTGVDIGFYITGRGSGGSQSDSIIIMSGGDSAGYRWGISYRNAGDTLQISGICKNGVSWENVGMSTNNYHSVKYNYTNNKDCYLDETLVRSEIPGGDATINYPVYLFASNMSGTVWRTGAFRVYYCKITENGNLIRDYIPALDPNGKPCLFDLITMTPYYNGATTGNDFTYGKKIYGIEYLEKPYNVSDSNKKPKITTGIIVDSLPVTFKAKVSGEVYDNPTYQGYVMVGDAQYPIGTGSGTPELYSKYNNQVLDTNLVLVTDKIYDISSTITSTNNVLTINGTSYTNTYSYTAGNDAVTLYPNYTTPKVRIYSFQMLKDTTLVADYIPARDEDNVGYMFDKVTHTLKANTGTGTFTLGNDNDTYFNTPKVSIIEEYEGELPKKYKRVEYLQSTGSQYITMDWVPSRKMAYDITVALTSVVRASENNAAIFGARDNSTSQTRTLFYIASTNPQYFRWDYSSQRQILTKGTDMDYDAGDRLHISWNGPTTTTDTVNLDTGAIYSYEAIPETTSDTLRKMMLFAVNNGGTAQTFSKIKIYSCKFWDDGVLKYNFVPCIDNTGKPCMYDMVEGKPYYNEGSGDDFLYGNIIKEVEYIDNETATVAASSPFTYIAEKLLTTTDFEIKFSTKGLNANSWFMGEPFWVGVHYKVDSGNKYIGVANYSSDANRYYVSYTDGDVVTIKTQGSDVYVNGTKVGSITRRDATQGLLGIFCYKETTQASPGMRLIGKLYYLNIWDNGNQTRKIVPAILDSGEYVLWDKITNTVYHNQQADTAFTGALLKSCFRTRKLNDENDIPDAYEKVKYIEANGTQYIDTGYTITVNDNIDATYDVSLTPFPSGRGLNGYSLSQAGFWGKTTSDTYELGSSNTQIAVGGRDIVRFTREIVNDSRQDTDLYINETVASHAQRNTTAETGDFQIFACNTSYRMRGKLYGATLKINGTTIRNFIPVVRKADDKPGLWDTITRTLFTNAGTGEFTYRKDTEGEYTAVNYIEATGTQYIDTGFAFVTSTDEIELEYQNTATAQHKWMFGSYETNANIGISSATITAPTFWYKGVINGTQEQQYNSKHKLVYDVYGMTNDGTNLKAYNAYTGTWNLYLFALNNTGTSPNSYFGYGKIYSYTHKRNGITLIDLVPVIRNSDDKPGMYDKVTGTFFTNIGTGEFTYG